MKKILILSIIVISLSACGNETRTDINEAKENQVAEVENQDQEAEENEDEEINRTYPEDSKEEVKKEVIDVDNSQDNNSKNEKAEEKEDSSDKDLEKGKKDKKNNDKDKEDGKNSDKEKEELTEDDYFFSYYSLVTVKDGEVVNALKDIGDYSDDYYIDYLPFSNNILVMGSVMNHDFSIRKIDGQELTLLYDFKENETFYPLAMIGDKIYGRYQYLEYNKGKGDYQFISEKSGLGVVDLKNNKLDVFKATNTSANESLVGVGISDSEALFTKMEENQQFNLYKLDLEQGFDQEAELVEENTKASNFLSSKNLKDGKASYEIFKSNENEFEINGKNYTVDDVKRMTLIGQNIIIQEPSGNSDDPEFLFKMDIINYLTGEVIEKDLEAFGYRVYNGKLYYIDYDKKVQSLEIGL